jgi:hypothetical protein
MPVADPKSRGSRVGDAEWWRGAVIYEIYPRSFQDTNGDGVGDLPGIVRRLPYLADLGVDAVWIAPFFASPMLDFGYDVSDYNAVDPMFGTIEDFDRLVAEAHRLGIKVMIDQVLSHTSDRHPWFAESRLSRDNPKADWYIWADAKPDGTPPNNWLSIFGGPAWDWDTRRGQYYLHNFLTAQPDLNFHNPDVQQALLDAVEFWLKRGVDGFRLDTVNFYFHSKGLDDNPPASLKDRNSPEAPAVNPYNWQDHVHDKSQPENLDFLRRLRALLDRYPGQTTVGEVGDGARSLRTMAAYTSGGDKLHMCYTFDFLSPIFTAAHFRERIAAFEAIVEDGWPCWAFSNHDIARHATRWAAYGDPERVARLAALAFGARRARRGLGVRPGVGRLEVDDVAKQDLPLGELVAPDDDRLEGERGFAEARDHRLAAGLDALGDGDLALAGEQLDRAHLAEIHADRIVGAVGRLAGGFRRDRGGRRLGELAALRLVVGGRVVRLLRLVGLDDVDAHVVEHRVDVFDLVGRGGVRGQHLVELVDGHVAALLRGLDHLLDGGVGKIEERSVRSFGRGFRRLFVFLDLGRHELSPTWPPAPGFLKGTRRGSRYLPICLNLSPGAAKPSRPSPPET